MLEGRLKVLQGRARRARGTARLELVRLEHESAREVARVGATLRESRDRVGEAIEAGRRRVDAAMRSIEPGLRRSRDRARRLGATARMVPGAAATGIRAGRRALSRGSK